MSKSDWAFLALNVILLFWAFLGLASVDTDVLMVSAMVAMAVSAANSVRTVRKRKTRASKKEHREADDEMDARTILDIDARLEALERREREMEEAERIRAMVARGEQSAPAAAESIRLGAEAERVRV